MNRHSVTMRFRFIFILFAFIILGNTRSFASVSINVLSHGADNTGKIDATKIIEECIYEGRLLHKDVYIPAGTYLLAGKINFNPENNDAEPLNPDTFYDWGNITIYGNGCETVFNGATRKASDTFNLFCVKNLHFRDFSVTNSIEELATFTSGSNTISVVNGENISFTNIKVYNAVGIEKDGCFDGGKGFTVQSTYAKDIIFTNCYAYNCPSGFLMQYDNRPSTNIVIKDCKAEKCQEGLFLGRALGRIRGVEHTAVIVKIDIINCMVGYREEIAEGVKANIRINNTQRLNRLRKDAKGKLWLQLDSLSEARQSSYACLFYGSYHSDIVVDIHAKQLNNVVLFDNYDSNATFSNGNNKISISMNPDINLVKNLAHKRMGKGSIPERKIYMVPETQTHKPFRNSEITFKGIKKKDLPQQMLVNGRNNIIAIDDRLVLSE